MSPALQIAWREYRQYVFSRGFLLFLILFPVGFIVTVLAFGWAERAMPERHFVVFDETGVYGAAIDHEIETMNRRRDLAAFDGYVGLTVPAETLASDAIPAPFAPDAATVARLAAFDAAGGVAAGLEAIRPFQRPGAPAFVPARRNLLRAPAPAEVAAAENAAEAAERLRPYLLAEATTPSAAGAPVNLFAAVVIPAGFGRENPDVKAQYWSRNLTDEALRSAIARALDTALSREKVAALGLDKAALDDILDTEAPIAAYRPDRSEAEAELGVRDRVEVILPGVLTYMLVFIIMGIGNLLLTNTIEERSNKIVEILLSSVTADELMLGKLIGIGAVGLTMPTIFLVLGGLIAVVVPGADDLVGGIGHALFSTPLFAIYIFYFFCAYAIFAMVFLAIGAVSNSLQDAQSFMGPLTLLLFAPLPFVTVMYQNPNGVIATVLTWIPIYTPYAVLLRVAADPPLWEIVGATAFMLVFAWFLSRIMGRVFRRAILSSTPAKIADFFRLAVRKDD